LFAFKVIMRYDETAGRNASWHGDRICRLRTGRQLKGLRSQ
jgi:hypothetical protein